MTAFLAKIIGYAMKYIYLLVNNYGLSIILLTLLVRLCLLPLYNKQNKYSSAMAELQPKITEIQTRYANDKETMNVKINELYQQEGVSPMAGCLPLIIQMPIIFGLFALLRNPLLYINGSEMIAAVHESFAWVPDLSQPDAWILPIIAGISTYFTSASSGADANGSMTVMKYFFPVMIFLIGRSSPAGLALYWAVGNIFSLIQVYYFNYKKKKDKREKEINAEVEKRLKRNK